MSRVQTLIEKLNSQQELGVSAHDVLQTARMLVAELQQVSGNSISVGGLAVNVAAGSLDIPQSKGEQKLEISGKINQESGDGQQKKPSYDELEKEFSILHVDEKEVEAELAEIKAHVAETEKNSQKAKQNNLMLFDPVEDIPTLHHQTDHGSDKLELHEKIRTSSETPSLNDLLKDEKPELSASFSDTPIKDLRKGIAVNDAYVFTDELFRGDDAMYARSIKTINGFSNYAEAKFWIERELKLKLGWKPGSATVKHFDHLVSRRFL